MASRKLNTTMDRQSKKLNTTMETLVTVPSQMGYEMKHFVTDKRINVLTWSTFALLCIANTLNLIVNVAPGWAWTLEISGVTVIEGQYYGHYGMWWACWELTSGEGITSCALLDEITDLNVPSWQRAVQGMSVCVIIFGFLSFVIICVYMFMKEMNRSLKMAATYIVVVILAEIANKNSKFRNRFLNSLLNDAKPLYIGLFSVAMFVTFCASFLYEMFWCCEPIQGRQVIEWHLWYCFILACCQTFFFMASGSTGIFEIVSIRKDVERLKRYEEAHRLAMERESEADAFSYGRAAMMLPYYTDQY